MSQEIKDQLKVGTSFIVGVILTIFAMLALYGPPNSYSGSMAELRKVGVITILENDLYYTTDIPGLERPQLKALAKMSEVYGIHLEMVEFGELDIDLNESK